MGGLMLASLVGFNSCELEQEIYDSINSGMFPTTEDDAEAMVTANAYGVFQNNGYSGLFNIATGYPIMSDLLSDYGECSWRQWEPVLYLSFTNSSNCNNLSSALYQHASFMGKMTMTIDRLEKMNLDEEVKKQYLAEMHCARGWLAFLMWDMFGPIPLPSLEALQNPLEEQIFPRATEEEMKKFIVDELTQAANVLPPSHTKDSPNYGRFTAGLCNTILMKFYMQTKQWAEAEKIGRELTNESKYGYKLIKDYRDLFTLANEKNEETIWAVNCLRGIQEHKWHPHVLPNDYPNTASLTKWNGWKISWDFFNTFEEGDLRKETLIYEYIGTEGEVHNQNNDRTNTDKKLYYGAVPLKYDYKDFAGTMGEDSETDYIIYRYADVVTLLAEAIVHNGKTVTQEAVDLLNSVRTRAGLTAYQLSEFSGPDDFIDKLLLERGHELIFESCRRQDLIRNDKYVEAIKQKAKYAGYPTLVNEKYERLPLPQSIIDEGKGIIKQNPGYY